ncbi:MAG: DUF202 domain-containing protein [Legionella sp.]|nr:DUF202 domain-containing protein [Legionella sp.]
MGKQNIDKPIIRKSDKIRDHLANERTFLAWVRTSISIIVFGFVVAKFGITLREFLGLQTLASKESSLSLIIGLGFTSMGILLAMLSFFHYRNTLSRIDLEKFEPSHLMIILLSITTFVFGTILLLYLAWSAQALFLTF